MFCKDCLMIYEKYKLISEIREKRYKVSFGSLETGLTQEIMVIALDKEQAEQYAKEKMKEYYPDFHYDLLPFVTEKEWPKEYLHHAIEDEDGYDAT